MTKVINVLQSINAYPIPMDVIEGIAIKRMLDIQTEASASTINGRAYNLCKADLLEWLSLAPNISQGGQSYSFNEDQRRQLRKEAQTIKSTFGESNDENKIIYGYKGSRL